MTWTSVVGYEGTYAVCSSGRVRNERTGHVLAGAVRPRGYVTICLSVNGSVERRLLHRIVAEAFIGPRPIGNHIDHIDGNPRNNAVSNLRYCTPRENIHFTVARGAHAVGSRNGQSKLTEVDVLRIRQVRAAGGRYWGAAALADELGVDECQVRRAAKGRSFKHVRALRGPRFREDYMTDDELPSVTMHEIVLRLRRLAISEPRLLPIAESIERITGAQEAHERMDLGKTNEESGA